MSILVEMNEQQKYDYVYIGTGPITAIDAIYKQMQSKGEVLLIDEKTQVGGAWVAIEVGDFGHLEVGCHIWSYNKKAYQFFRNFLNLELIALSPQPFFVKGNKKLTYDYKNAALTFKKIANDSLRLRFKSLMEFLFKNPSARLPIIPKKYLYPKGGAREIQAAIIKALRDREIKMELGQKVVSASKKKGYWQLQSNNGKTYMTKELYLTSTSALERIEFDDRLIEIEHRKVNYSHFHLVIDRKLKQKLSYVRVLDDPYIHRLSDITYQLEKQSDPNQTVLLVGFFYDKKPVDMSDNSLVEHIFIYLKKRNWVGEDVKLVYSQINHFETTYIPNHQIEAINNLDHTIQLIHTTDLIYGVHRKLKEWRI